MITVEKAEVLICLEAGIKAAKEVVEEGKASKYGAEFYAAGLEYALEVIKKLPEYKNGGKGKWIESEIPSEKWRCSC